MSKINLFHPKKKAHQAAVVISPPKNGAPGKAKFADGTVVSYGG